MTDDEIKSTPPQFHTGDHYIGIDMYGSVPPYVNTGEYPIGPITGPFIEEPKMVHIPQEEIIIPFWVVTIILLAVLGGLIYTLVF